MPEFFCDPKKNNGLHPKTSVEIARMIQHQPGTREEKAVGTGFRRSADARERVSTGAP
jgi:hypothetical protein